MINPKNITNFHNTDSGLEEFLLFAISVAGKSSHQQAKKLDAFLSILPVADTPFAQIRSVNSVRPYLEQVRMGQYSRITNAFENVANSGLDLRTSSLNDLESIPGVGFKTSRFFVLHSRVDAHVACLDTHILRYMREELGVLAPSSTPKNQSQYLELESIFLNHCLSVNKSIAELDLLTWNQYSKSSN